jgi:hypothetical protein
MLQDKSGIFRLQINWENQSFTAVSNQRFQNSKFKTGISKKGFQSNAIPPNQFEKNDLGQRIN